MNCLSRLLAIVLFCGWVPAQAEDQTPEITILSTMVANFTGVGEWGFSALIEGEGAPILFDTGFKSQTVLTNAAYLGKDLSAVETVILTHFHTDHTGGLLTLREAFRDKNDKAFSTVYVAKGFFEQRYSIDGDPIYSIPTRGFLFAIPEGGFTRTFTDPAAFKAAAGEAGISFVEIDGPTEIAPGMVLTGPIGRIHDEKNVGGGFFLKRDGKLIPDTVPESQVLGIKTAQGWMLVSGCGHAGIINASEQLRAIEDRPILLGVGGFHLFRATDETISWTADRLRAFGLKQIIGAHCTGAYATAEIARQLGLPRTNVSIGAIGTRVDRNMTIKSASID